MAPRGEQKRVEEYNPAGYPNGWIAGWFFLIEKEQRKDLEMAVIGLAILGVLLGAAGMQFLRSSKPELVEKAEDSLKRFVNFVTRKNC